MTLNGREKSEEKEVVEDTANLELVSSVRGGFPGRLSAIVQPRSSRPTSTALPPYTARRSATSRWRGARDRSRPPLRPSVPSWSWSAPGWWTARSCLCARRSPVGRDDPNKLSLQLFSSYCSRITSFRLYYRLTPRQIFLFRRRRRRRKKKNFILP